jgi:hypothetical protein
MAASRAALINAGLSDGYNFLDLLLDNLEDIIFTIFGGNAG